MHSGQCADESVRTFRAPVTNTCPSRLPSRAHKARDLYARMMRTLAQTGNGWITFKDASNRACNQTAVAGRTVHLSNLCTEIIEVTSADESAVCNLGSINLGRHVVDAEFDFGKLARTVRTAIRQLDRVIDLNYYPASRGCQSVTSASIWSTAPISG